MVQVLWSIVLVLLYVFVSIPETLATPLSRKEFLRKVQQTHPFIQAEDLREAIAHWNQQSTLGSQDWQMAVGAEYFYLEPNDAFIENPDNAFGYNSFLGAEKKFWETGGTLGLRFEQFQENQRPTGFTFPTVQGPFTISRGPFRQYDSGITLSYTQPLLRNFGGILDRLPFATAGLQLEMEKLRLKEAQEEFLFRAGNRFIAWELLSELKSILSNRLKIAQRQRERAYRMLQENTIEKVDTLRSDNDVLIAQQALGRLQAEWLGVREELAELASVPPEKLEQPVVALTSLDPLPELNSAQMELMKNARLLQIVDAEQRRLRLEQSGAQERKKSELDLITSVGVRGYDDHLEGSLALDQPNASIGIQYRFPVENRLASSQYSRFTAELARAKQEYHSTEKELRSSLRAFVEELRRLAQVLEINRRQIAAAAKRTKEEMERYKRGESDFTFVLNSQDLEQQAKEIFARNGANYQQLSLALRALRDQLL